jgi:hypothetical protein
LTERGRDFRSVIWALLAWGNNHLTPEGPSVVIVDANTGVPADPILVDRASLRPLQAPAFRAAPGPAANDDTRKRHGVLAGAAASPSTIPRNRRTTRHTGGANV